MLCIASALKCIGIRRAPQNASADKVLEDALLILKSAQNEPALYETSVETGKNLILACLELGFSYMEHMELFDFLLEPIKFSHSELIGNDHS